METGETSSFQHRIVRIIAILAIILAVNGIFGVTVAIQARWTDFPWNGLNLANYLLLAVGSIALLNWKSWGRVCLIIWAISTLAFYAFAQAYFVYHYFGVMAATTQSTQQPSRVYIALSYLLSTFPNVIFPIAVLAIMRSKEVREMWARRPRSGFEVLPVQPLEVTKAP